MSDDEFIGIILSSGQLHQNTQIEMANEIIDAEVVEEIQLPPGDFDSFCASNRHINEHLAEKALHEAGYETYWDGDIVKIKMDEYGNPINRFV